jgi:hypothetical protein
MKIQLERKLSSCPDQMTCIVCHEQFWTRNIRALLYSKNNLIQGDVCPSCIKLKALLFQKKLRNQANRLIQESILKPSQCDALQDRAVELLETSEEHIAYPTMFQWLLKKIEVFTAESQELEAARLKGDSCRFDGRSLPVDHNPARSPLISTDES